jgi:hypothetical protein
MAYRNRKMRAMIDPSTSSTGTALATILARSSFMALFNYAKVTAGEIREVEGALRTLGTFAKVRLAWV